MEGISVQQTARAGDTLFLYGLTWEREAYFFRVDISSLAAETLEGFCPEGAELVSASPDGSFHALTVGDDGNYLIKSLSPDGSVAETGLKPKSYGGGMIYGFYALENGFILKAADATVALDKNGKLIHDYGGYMGAEKLVPLQDKLLLIRLGMQQEIPGAPTDTATVITELDAELKPGPSYRVETLFTDFFAGEGNSLLAFMDNTLYSYDYTAGEAQALVNTFTSNMSTMGLVCLDGGSYISLDMGRPCIWRLASTEEAVVLTLATYEMSFKLEDAVKAFNEENSSYVIEPIDYAMYDSYESSGEGFTRLANDIITGNTPDIFDLKLFTPENLAAKGLLEDLKPYFDGDGSIDYQDLLPCIRRNCEYNGAMYELIPFFLPVVLCGDRSIVGDDWSVERFVGLTDEYSHAKIIGFDFTRTDFLNYVLCFMKEQLYSTETLECDFVNEDFISMLEFSKGLLESYVPDGSGGLPLGRAYTGDQLLVFTFTPYIIDEMSFLNTAFSGEAQLAGFPGSESSGFGMHPILRLGMSSSSEHKMGVWEFFRFLLSDKEAYVRRYYGLPATGSGLEVNLEYQLSSATEITPTVYLYSNDGTVSFEGVPVEEESARAQIYYMLEKIDSVTICERAILDIVLQSAQPFYYGDRSAEDVAKDIQSRVSIYLAEQYG